MQKLNMAILANDIHEIRNDYIGKPIDQKIQNEIYYRYENLLMSYIYIGMIPNKDISELKVWVVYPGIIRITLPQWIIDEAEKNPTSQLWYL